MAKKVVIVESPSKSKTISKYLGNDYTVTASVGHIRDLATTGKGGLGIDIDNGFKPNYQVLPGKKSIVNDLNSIIKNAKEIYLATDPDREGEAISWHPDPAFLSWRSRRLVAQSGPACSAGSWRGLLCPFVPDCRAGQENKGTGKPAPYKISGTEGLGGQHFHGDRITCGNDCFRSERKRAAICRPYHR